MPRLPTCTTAVTCKPLCLYHTCVPAGLRFGKGCAAALALAMAGSSLGFGMPGMSFNPGLGSSHLEHPLHCSLLVTSAVPLCTQTFAGASLS